jgi:DNA invertase Pin-like site-specific DNA recombinase
MSRLDPPLVGARLARAASYTRMSTRGQNFSIDLQQARIEAYALEHHFDIVKVYVDEGKSGLRIKGRLGLQALIADVLNNSAGFEYILVYDVSRWGRFQDVDESAYYEHICRNAGIKVIYCSEQFSNDGSPLAAILKAIKRSMAAEFSRELSVKVFAAQSKLALLGYKQGGSAGYGLRRLALRADGTPDRLLSMGDMKGAPTHRVVLVPGPPNEVANVRLMYRWYVEKGLGDTQIAVKLNAKGAVNPFGRGWTPWMVKNILTNEKYRGHNVFNRRSCKLRKISVLNAAELWVRKDLAFQALIADELYERAQAERSRRLERRTAEALLATVRAIHAAEGRVTTKLLVQHGQSTTPKLLARHFGTITNAYIAAGIPSERKLMYGRIKHAVNEVRKTVLLQVAQAVQQGGAFISSGPSWATLTLNGKISLRIAVVRCRFEERGLVRWRIQTGHPGAADFILVARLDHANVSILDFFLFPSAEFPRAYIVVRDERPDELERYRHQTLRTVFGLH